MQKIILLEISGFGIDARYKISIQKKNGTLIPYQGTYKVNF